MDPGSQAGMTIAFKYGTYSPMKNKPTEKSSLRKRAARYAKIGGRMSGVAVRGAGKRLLGIEIHKSSEAKQLAAALGGLKGPLMKIAQILGTIPDAVPEEYVRELRQLQSQAPSMGWPFVRRRMASELGADWQGQFQSFDQAASAAASLGQVHRAKTKSGADVACKLQYPDMQSAVDADLKQLALILKIYQKMHGGVLTDDVFAEISDRLREELDYVREAKNIALYQKMLAGEGGVHIPKTFANLSTGRLLTMQWMDGKPILDFKGASQKIRDQLAINMFRAWYVPFYRYGVIHGDPHLGNYSVRPDHSINLLDFGCIRIFKPEFVGGVIDLYLALRDRKPDLAVAAYKSWGFQKLNKDLIAVLNLWAEFLYGPILKDKPVSMRQNFGGKQGQKVASQVHAELKRIGGVAPPREFVFMDRAAVGLGSVFIHLDAEINWYRVFHELIQDFDVKKLAHAQAGVVIPSLGEGW